MVLESRRISAELQIIIQNKKHETYSFKKNIKISMSRVGEMQVSFYWQIKRSQFEGVNVHINTKKNKKVSMGILWNYIPWGWMKRDLIHTWRIGKWGRKMDLPVKYTTNVWPF